MSGRQRRFQSHINHTIVKRLVQKAKRTRRALALEEVTHIRQRTEQRVRTSRRTRLGARSFAQLRRYISSRSTMVGFPVLFVDPRHTSQMCNRCKTVDQRNCPDQTTFRCVRCGHATSADVHAARNIRDRATVSLLLASRLRVQVQAHLF
ncbi:MAG: zinc ribbon domain-containing protein [Roseiflexus sp.]